MVTSVVTVQNGEAGAEGRANGARAVTRNESCEKTRDKDNQRESRFLEHNKKRRRAMLVKQVSAIREMPGMRLARHRERKR